MFQHSHRHRNHRMHHFLPEAILRSGSSQLLLSSMNFTTLRKSHQMFNNSTLGGAPQNQSLTQVVGFSFLPGSCKNNGLLDKWGDGFASQSVY